MADFFPWDTRAEEHYVLLLVGILVVTIYLWFFHSIPLAHIGF